MTKHAVFFPKSLRGAMLATLLTVATHICRAQSPQEPARCSVAGESQTGTAATEAEISDLRRASFPELTKVNLGIRTFHSDADYFRTRFSISRFFLPVPMHYIVEVNPKLFTQQPPADGVCSVLAHELSHVVALNHGNRIRRLGLLRLLSAGYTAKFERRTDLEAIRRGYGDGLKSYRSWVYAHIPPNKLAAKRRNYFSPEEIDALQQRLQAEPQLFSYWSKRVPLNLTAIRTARP